MQYLRTKIFVGFCLVLTVLYALPIPVLALTGRPRKALRYVARSFCGTVLWACSAILGLSFRVEGTPPCDRAGRGPVIFAAQHQSAWETVALFALLDDAVIILKQSLLKILFVGWYFRHLGMIDVDREAGRAALTKMLRDSTQAVERGHSILIFPEGTRRPFRERPALKSGIYLLYRHLGLPVVPVALNSGAFWPRRADVIRSGVITLSFLPALEQGMERVPFLAALHGTMNAESDRLAKCPEAVKAADAAG